MTQASETDTPDPKSLRRSGGGQLRRDPWRSRLAQSLLYSLALRAVRPLHGPLAWLGVDVPRFRALLEARLLLDLGTEVDHALRPALVTLLFWLLGIAPGVAAIAGAPPFVWMGLLHGLSMLLLGGILFAEYGDLLVDPTDIGVVEARPVDDRTVFAARLVHALLHTLVPTAFFGSWSVLLGCFGQPLVAALVVVPVTLALSSLLTLGLVGIVHAGVLRLAGPARFQRAIFLARTAGLILVVSQGTVFAALDQVGLDEWIEEHPGSLAALHALPPAYYGGLLELVLGGVSPLTLGLSAAGVILPFAALWIALRLGSRHFVAGLRGDLEQLPEQSLGWRRGPVHRLLRRLARGEVERCGFDFAWVMVPRDKGAVRGMVVTVAGLTLSVVGWQLFGGQIGEGLASVAGVQAHVVGTLLLLIPGKAAYTQAPPLARDVFRALPRAEHGLLLSGGLTAVVCRLVLPAALVILGSTALGGPVALARATLSAVASSCIALAGLRRMTLALPFTGPPARFDFGNIGVFAATIAVQLAVVALHVPLALFAPAWVEPLLALPFAVLLVRSFEQLHELEPAELGVDGSARER